MPFPTRPFVRLGVALFAFALSSCAIVPASSLVLWIVTALVMEWGHWLALATLAFLIWNLFAGRGWLDRVASSFLVLAVILFSVPVMEAIPIARALPGKLTTAFGSLPQGAGVPTSPLDFGRLWWVRHSEAVRLRTLRYVTQDGSSLPLDFYSNEAAGNRPCIIVVHGGAWHTDNEKELKAWNPRLAELGYRVASIAYRLAPRSHWPAQKEDLLAAIAFLKAHASDLGIDSNRFVLLGRSAGAQIILATAYASNDPSIRGCIASYPPTDMNFDYGPAASHSLLNAKRTIAQFLGGTPDQIPGNYHDASPLQLAGPDSPPSLLAQGTRDEIVWIENSRRLQDRLAQLHRPVYLLEMPWATHGFDLNPDGPGGQLEFYAMAWFLGYLLGSKS